jgi:hypothetical protein
MDRAEDAGDTIAPSDLPKKFELSTDDTSGREKGGPNELQLSALGSTAAVT